MTGRYSVPWLSRPRRAEEIIASGQADAVLPGPGPLRNPCLSNQATRELGSAGARRKGYPRVGVVREM
ncbi:hypothetical protein ACIBF6_30150 [Streptosporangium amethystogenes]|uniref:hypothetical protein n=1 Tax=Streptosporangium amethystogenes TaxID=2002 RepID=UPI00378FC0A2